MNELKPCRDCRHFKTGHNGENVIGECSYPQPKMLPKIYAYSNNKDYCATFAELNTRTEGKDNE